MEVDVKVFMRRADRLPDGGVSLDDLAAESKLPRFGERSEPVAQVLEAPVRPSGPGVERFPAEETNAGEEAALGLVWRGAVGSGGEASTSDPGHASVVVEADGAEIFSPRIVPKDEGHVSAARSVALEKGREVQVEQHVPGHHDAVGLRTEEIGRTSDAASGAERSGLFGPRDLEVLGVVVCYRATN